MCFTAKLNCCNLPNRLGEWYFPNGSTVGIRGKNYAMYRDRGPSVVRLNLRKNSKLIAGIFHCEVPNIDEGNQSIYVGIYPINKGMKFTIICCAASYL